MTRLERANLRKGLLFISPWIIGFLAFSAYPLIATLAYSFTDYSVLSDPVPIGADNYKDLVNDELFWKAIYNTLFFALLSVPLSAIVACGLAILLNFDVLGKGIYRTIFFLPSLVPMVCLGVIWRWLLNGELGLINNYLQPILDIINGITGASLSGPSWLVDPSYTKIGLVIAALWGVGHAMVIYLAGLQETPRQLYEAADIDGAGFRSKLWHVTLPILSPYIFFNTIMGLIGSFQVFAVPYVMMDPPVNPAEGPENSMLFVATYIFQNAFTHWNMGYACAISLIFFLIVVSLTLAVMKISERRVHYAGH